MDYEESLTVQRSLFTARRAGLIDHVFMLLEHPPLYTIGRRYKARDHLLVSEDELASRGIPVYETDRGGDITYHGPGQLVGYPIFDLTAWYQDVFRYLRDLEEVIIRVVADYGIQAERIDGLTGVWVQNEKIAALGIKMSWWVTRHGFSLNVDPDLCMYDHIVPCGIFDKSVTSLSKILESRINMDQVSNHLIKHMASVFEIDFEKITLQQLMKRIP
ncbi:MAG TPA: lipoyl(octanoyl) transferase [Candidatus Latescibacteria bacterium]|jgi:lipoate-protein ligase B|nr:lipoyl(octanoyl) transferase [Candidatus Latescibacterota bacterium]